MKTLALLTAHAAAQSPSDEVPAMPKNVRTITAEECRNEILRQDILFRTYLSFCPKHDTMRLAGNDKRLNNAFQKQGYLIQMCQQHGGLNPEQAINTIQGLLPLLDLTERQPDFCRIPKPLLRLGGIIGRRRNRNGKANAQKCVPCRAKPHPCQAVAGNDEGLGVLTI